MRSRASLVALTLAVSVAAFASGVGSIPPAAAVGSESGSGELSGATLGVGIEVSGAGHTIPIDAHSPSLPRLVHYIATAAPAVQVGDLGGLCNAAANNNAPVVFGWFYEVVGYANDGRVVSQTQECFPYVDPNNRSVLPVPTGLPVAPTVGDVWRAVELPRPVVGVNPVSRGVTGLATRLWSGGPQTAQVAVSIGGYRVTGTAHVVGYRFSTDEGDLGETVAPGDSEHPAAIHEFAFKGAHSLSVASVWQADVTMIGPGGAGGPAPIPTDIETAVLTATVAYPVVEVRSRLVG